MMTRRPDLVGCASAVRRGFTLVELVTAMGISSIVLVALGSSILIASRAMPPVDDPTLSALNAGSASSVLADDLRYATAFSTLTATAVEFTVPDRTGDNTPELIRYEWSGVAGAPLRRQINGGSWTTVLSRVASLALSYNTKTVTTTTPITTVTTSPELLLSKFDGWLLITPTIVNNAVGTSNWASEFFTIDQLLLPASTTGVAITRVRLYLQRATTAGSMTVGIYDATGDATKPQPLTTTHGTPATVALSALPAAYAWYDIAMPSDVSINPSTLQYCIVVKGSVSSAASVQMYQSVLASSNGSVGMWSTNAGGKWNPTSGSSLYQNDHRYYLYGTYTTSTTANITTSTYFLNSVGITIQPNGTAGPTIATATQVYGNPQVTLP